MNENQHQFVEKLSKVDEILATLIKINRKEIHMTHVKDKSCDRPIDATEYRHQKDNKEILRTILCQLIQQLG